LFSAGSASNVNKLTVFGHLGEGSPSWYWDPGSSLVGKITYLDQAGLTFNFISRSFLLFGGLQVLKNIKSFKL